MSVVVVDLGIIVGSLSVSVSFLNRLLGFIFFIEVMENIVYGVGYCRFVVWN